MKKSFIYTICCIVYFSLNACADNVYCSGFLEHLINVSNLPNGTYYLHVSDKPEMRQIVVEH